MSPRHRTVDQTEAQEEMAEAARKHWVCDGIIFYGKTSEIPALLTVGGEAFIYLILRDRRTALNLREDSWFLEKAKADAGMARVVNKDVVVRFVVWCPDGKMRWVEVNYSTLTASRSGTMLRTTREGETRDPGWYVPWSLFREL